MLIGVVLLFLFGEVSVTSTYDLNRCETCREFRLHDDYCAPRAVVLGHVRRQGWYDEDNDYYNVNVNQIFRRSFKIKMGSVRILTPRVCGKKLEVGQLYILGIAVDREINSNSLKISRCTLALKHSEISPAVRNAIVRRRIDCSCGETSCGSRTCNSLLQSFVNSLPDVDTRKLCLSATSFCSRYTAKGDCCWTIDLEKVSRCYEDSMTPDQTELPPIENYEYGARVKQSKI